MSCLRWGSVAWLLIRRFRQVCFGSPARRNSRGDKFPPDRCAVANIITRANYCLKTVRVHCSVMCKERETGKQLCVLLTPRRRSDARGDLVICVKSDTHKHSFHRFARLPSRSVGWKDRRWCASAGEITRIIFHTDQTQSTCRLSSLALYYKQRPHPPPNRPRLALINFLNTFWCVSRHKQFLFRLFDSRMPLTHKNVSGSVGEQTEPSIMSPKTVNQSGVGGLRLRLNH